MSEENKLRKIVEMRGSVKDKNVNDLDFGGFTFN